MYLCPLNKDPGNASESLEIKSINCESGKSYNKIYYSKLFVF